MKKICLLCGKEFESKTKSKYCCSEHKFFGKNKKKFPDGTDYVECKICSYRGNDLHKHICAHHLMTIDEYCSQFQIKELDLISYSCRKHNSDMQKILHKEGKIGWQKGGKNPSHDIECKMGRRSAWSMNYKGYDGLPNSEKRRRIKELSNKVVSKMNSAGNNSLRIEYYIQRGYSIDEAKALLKQRQATFTLEKCIKQYGKEKGQKIFDARQKKWQDTLNAKPQEEKDRINKERAKSSSNLVGYSKISQKLFNSIYDCIKNDYSEIFYATLNLHNMQDAKNNEYEVILDDGIHRYFLDFYVKDNNKVIEFDGDYWHGEKRGNQERDKCRENDLIRLGYVNILHVKEKEYRNNPSKVLRECLEFIRK